MQHELDVLADPDAVARAGAMFVAKRGRERVAGHGRPGGDLSPHAES
ncbi:MAG TPA: hypothetical protein VEJ84_16115 [Acidimicrobiales bacterium]|nr:hypothetical protein [Acidimicrobiales bacterium]